MSEHKVRTWAIANFNTEGALRQLYVTATDEQIDAIPGLRDWYEWHQWWWNLPQEERDAIFKANWSYD